MRDTGTRDGCELVLKSRWVLPGVLTEAGYEFRHPELRGALESVVADR